MSAVNQRLPPVDNLDLVEIQGEEAAGAPTRDSIRSLIVQKRGFSAAPYADDRERLARNSGQTNVPPGVRGWRYGERFRELCAEEFG